MPRPRASELMGFVRDDVMREHIPFLVWCVLTAAAVAQTPPTAAPPARKPNVILITVDTLRADHLGVYGRSPSFTPAMDSLARDSAVFDHAVAQVPLTLASHAAILTGTYPFFNRVQDFTGEPMRAEVETVAQAFHRNGYATAAVVSAFVLDRSWGLDRGFDAYFDSFAAKSFAEKNLGLVDRKAGESVDLALAWLRKRPANKPFFLWLHLYDPHSPYEPPEPFHDRFRGDLYSGEIAYTDSQLGRFFQTLKTLRLYDGAAIVLLSDHGESLGEHGEKEHGYFLYPSTTHVPLMVKPPKKSLSRRVEAAAQTMAVAPTLLALAGVKDRIEKQFQTSELLSLSDHPDATAYSETMYPFSSFGWSPLRSLQSSELQFIDAPKAELYRAGEDPLQTRNLAGAQPAVAEVMRQKIKELTGKFAAPEAGSSNGGISPEAAEKLRALGYVAYKSPVSAEALSRGLPDPKDKLAEFNAILAAADAFQAGDIGRGRNLLAEVRESDAEMYLVPFMLGEAALKRSEWRSAADELERCLKLNPGFDQAMTGLARAYQQLGRLDDARGQLRRALEANPQNYRAWYQSGLLEWQADPAAARKALESAVRIQPNFAAGQRDLGYLLYQQKDFAGAFPHLAEAVRQGVEDRETLNAAGIAANQAGEPAKALNFYRQAVKLYPDFPEAHLNMGLALQRLGREKEAATEYALACKLATKYCGIAPRK